MAEIRGYAALFESDSQDLGGFIETIAPGAFGRSLASGADVRALFNHDPNHVLGRTKSGTLKLREDRRGLWFAVQLPPTALARDLGAQIARGDISQMSFAFSLVRESWAPARPGELPRRTLLEVNLHDVSPVTYPAYAATSVEFVPGTPAARPLTLDEADAREAARVRAEAVEREDWRRRIRLAEME